MKHIKKFEKYSPTDPDYEDYVIAVPDNLLKGSEYFFNNTIGKIVKKSRDYLTRDFNYGIEYENIPDDISKYYCAWREKDGKQYRENIIWFEKDMIKYHSTNKEDVQNVLNNDNMIYINGRYYKLMTPEQIEDWKMKNNVNKYNL